MNETDKATLASIAALLVADRISVAKALEGAFLLGELSGKIAMASIGQDIAQDVFRPALDLMSGKATHG